MIRQWRPDQGAYWNGVEGTLFRVWAPRCAEVGLKLYKKGRRPWLVPMEKRSAGYFQAQVQGVRPGDRYAYVLDGKKERPDPASRSQPEGVHRPSAVVDADGFRWSDAKWRGIAMADVVFYELHIGTFTPEGTFAAAIKRIPELKRLGVTCLEIMPVAQFPGRRNWGYDGVGPYAVQQSYGGPRGLKALVDACHRQGIAVCLDVVYNHLGPEGNYLHDYGPYFTDRYRTPWGSAVNYDGPSSGPVRRFIIDNALFWVTEYHIDALRLDAVHAIYDLGAKHILEELNDEVQVRARELGRGVHVVAESDLNDPKLVRPKTRGGFGLASQWSDDFHHAMHVELTGERNGYYEDFSGLPDVAKALRDRFVYDGRYSGFRARRYGAPAADLPYEKFVVGLQNHDQIGNRALGDRLSASVSFEQEKAAAALLVLSPFIPLLFMGQEYGERSPFQYFIDHGDRALVEAVRKGRRAEFAAFGWKDLPDPASNAAFRASKLRWDRRRRGPFRHLLSLYQDLIALRKSLFGPAQARERSPEVSFDAAERWVSLEYPLRSGAVGLIASFEESRGEAAGPFGRRAARVLLNTRDRRYGGSVRESAHAVVLRLTSKNCSRKA